MASNRYDIAIVADSTGSMAPLLKHLINNIKKVVKELFEKIPGVRISIAAFQDYNDDYMWKAVDFTVEQESLIHFLENLKSVPGIEGPPGWSSRGEGKEECIEYAFYEVQKLNWLSDSSRSLIFVSDTLPHTPKIALDGRDWKVELNGIKSKGINIYSVQAMSWGNDKKIKDFFRHIAMETNGYHLYIDQFAHIIELMTAICFKQMGAERLETYQNELRVKNNGMTTSMRQMFDVLLGKATVEEIDEENHQLYGTSSSSSESTSSAGAGASSSSRVSSSSGSRKKKIDYTQVDQSQLVIKPSHPARFQVLNVTNDMDIKAFADANGVPFVKGKFFYQFNKPELIQNGKEIILREKTTGHFYEGLGARKMLNLIEYDDSKKIKPTDFPEYDVFIQSTSANRKMTKDALALYDAME